MSCRSVAYRARRGGKQPASSARPAEPDAAPRQSRYGSIPTEVLDILAKYFSQRDDMVRTELAAAQRRAAELQHALDEATAAPRCSAEESQATLVAAQERIRKLTAELERSKAESADKCDKLATKLETLSRQKQADTDALAKRDDELKTLEAELRSTRAKAAEQADEQAKQLADLQRAVEKEQKRASQLDTQATDRERKVKELQDKLTAAEARASQDADKLGEQTAKTAELEARLIKAERQGQGAQAQDAARDRDHETLQRQVRELQARIATEDAATRQRLAALQAERDQLQAECALHRERAEREAADSVYDPASSHASQLVRTLLEGSIEPTALQDHMQRFGYYIWWSGRWFVRQFVRALLGSERPVQAKEWAMQTMRSLQRESQQSVALFPDGFSAWAEANPILLGQLALCVAGSTAMRVTGAMPAEFKTATQGHAAPPAATIAAMAPLHTAAPLAAPPPVPEVRPRTRREPAAPVSAPFGEPAAPPPSAAETRRTPHRAHAIPASAPTPVHAPSTTQPSRSSSQERPATAVPQPGPEPLKHDRLVSIKQDLLSVSHMLADLQDIMNRPITGQRLREGASISEQALEQAMAERWSYIHSPPPERKTSVFWVQHGVLLDEESERELRDRATEKWVDLSASLRILEAKRRR